MGREVGGLCASVVPGGQAEQPRSGHDPVCKQGDYGARPVFGALAVINGDITVGGLVAFNMIMNQVTAPILRLSQLWQDFQQVQISVDRLGDILDSAPESRRLEHMILPPIRGAISIRELTFRYVAGGVETLGRIDLDIPAGQVIGIVGPSGSGNQRWQNLFNVFIPLNMVEFLSMTST